MKISMTRGLIACATAACALLVGGAGAASAATAAFNQSGTGLTPTGSLVFKVGATPTPARTFTCAPANIAAFGASVSNAGTPAVGYSTMTLTAACYNATGQFAYVKVYGNAYNLQAQKIGSVFSLKPNESTFMTINSTAGTWASNGGTVITGTAATWTNGSGVTPSSVALADTRIGTLTSSTDVPLGDPITLSGTLKFQGAGGTLVTLS